MQVIIDNKVKQMQQDGVIESAMNLWSSRVVKKKNEKNRFCIDFCRVNEVIELDLLL